ncbi:hypothetical protein [Saliphagus infecundisoli]|uniref:Acetyl-CoA synthetase n=1 Tax=Saliphagus infecundisoli TaxID=1849069 RepID=A0ABD5QHM3_9EURY|nr:hypothetical protein [Saliphagus infecundisoli]
MTETAGELFVRERRSEAPALVDREGRTYDYDWLFTSTWKAGNFLRHSGVREGVSVGVVGDGPIALLAGFGTALLSSTVRFAPPEKLGEEVRALVAPVATLEEYDLPRGAQRVGYGGEADDPAVHDLEAGLWSENPSFPPVDLDPDTPMVADGGATYSHRDLFETAHAVAAEHEFGEGTRVRPAGGFADPRAFAAGVLAPLVAGGTVVLDGEADVAIGGGDDEDGPDRVSLSRIELDSWLSGSRGNPYCR